MTVLDAILLSLSRAGERHRDDPVAPAVILWPDQERQWEPLLPTIPLLYLPGVRRQELRRVAECLPALTAAIRSGPSVFRFGNPPETWAWDGPG